MIHLTLQQLSAFLDDELVESSAEIVRRHLAKCEECTVKFATLEETAESLAEALAHDLDEDELERIAVAVEAAIQTLTPTGKAAPAAARERAPRADRAARPERARQPEGASRPERAPQPEPARPQPEPVARPEIASVREQVIPRPEPAARSEDAPRREQAPHSERAPRSELAHAATPSPEITEDPPQEKRSPVAWFAAAAVFVIAASVCVVGIRSGRFVPREGSVGQTTVEATPPAATPPAAPPPAAPPPAPAESPILAAAPTAPSDQTPAPVAEPQTVAASPPPAPVVAAVPTPRPAARPSPSPPPVAPSASAKRTAAAAPRAVSPSESVESGHLLGSPAKNLIPVIRTRTTVETLMVEAPSPAGLEPRSPAPAPAAVVKGSAPRAKKDEFASLPPNILAQVRFAERRLNDAANDPAATGYDAAAVEWERALSLLRGTPHEVAVRLQLAQARYRAWQLAPNAYRSASATAALRSFVMMAASGPDRDEAKERLADLKR